VVYRPSTKVRFCGDRIIGRFFAWQALGGNCYWKTVSAVVLAAFVIASFRILVLGTPVMVVPNDYAAFLVMLPTVRWFMGRLAFILCLSLAVAASIVIDSRLCLMLCAVGLIWGERRLFRWNAGTISASVMALGLVIILAVQTGFINKLQQLPTSRIPVWDAAINQVLEAPLFGSGAYAFGPYYEEHIGKTDYPAFITVDTRYMPWAHNLFLDVAVAFGIPASMLLLALLLFVLVKALRAGDCLGNAIFGSVLLFLLASMVEFTHLRLYTHALVVLFLGYLVPNSN